MTEVPEHLLARSRSRRSAMGGGGGEEASAPAASTPATTSDAAPATSASAPAVPAPAAAPAAPEPVAPWVQAAQTRQKIPIWAVPVLAMLPLWGVVYALTLDPPTPTEPGAYELGAEVYNGPCAGCHGAAGGGQGAVPGLVGSDSPAIVFERPADLVTWIALGTAGYEAAGLDTYGDGRAVRGSGAAMPGWLDSFSAEEIMAVSLHVRYAFGNDEAFDAELWEDGFEEAIAELLPADRVPEFLEILEEWAADPPAP